MAKGLDLITVGGAIIDNNKEQVEAWIESGQLSVPEDDRALAWHEGDAELWALVIAPWVLVQET